MKVTLLSHTPEPEQLIAAAAKLCYSQSDIEALREKMTPESADKFLKMLMSLGHQSPIEHVTFTFGIEGVSRAFLAQITRHRIASYSVQSQRYVRADAFEYVMPPAVEKNPRARSEFEKTMADCQKAYDTLAELLTKQAAEELIAQGESEEKAWAKAEKIANEDARFVLPNACETKMVVTMNARSLHNFFTHRGCVRAQWEIRQAAEEMLRLVSAVAPTLFASAGPGCVRGNCTEGKMSCGKPKEVRERFAALKRGEEVCGQVDCH